MSGSNLLRQREVSMEMVILGTLCAAAALYILSTNAQSKKPALQPIRIEERNESKRRR